MGDWRSLVKGEIPPWVMRFIKQVGRGINNHSMIREDERVLLSISGGKDSLALALALALRLKWLPINYTMEGLLINWIENPIAEEALEELHHFFEALNIPLTVANEHQYPESFKGEFNCYLCARNRRRVLFTYADQHNYKLIATGHHLDDLVETSLLNLTSRATFATMLPVQEFFKGTLHIIRPMIEVRETTIKRVCDLYNLPVVKPVCPYDHTNIRSKLKTIVKQLSRLDSDVREHFYNAHQFSYKIPRGEGDPPLPKD